jgi:hypothetical protein
MPFHEIFSSSNLSGLNVNLKRGALYAENMSLNSQRLFFNEQETPDSKQETRIDTTGISHLQIFRSDNQDLVTVESTLNNMGLIQSYNYSRDNVSYDNGLGLDPAGLIVMHQNENEVVNRLLLDPRSLNVSTTTFTLSNRGDVLVNSNTSLQLKGDSVQIVSESVLQLKGDMITTTTGGYINKYLKVQICNASGIYEQYQIPLMNPM